MKKILDFFSFKGKPPKKKHNGCVYCCNCGNVLDDSKSKIKQLNDFEYEFNCYQCNRLSIFNYGIAPVPILMNKEVNNEKERCKHT